jgi:maleylacetate reductase
MSHLPLHPFGYEALPMRVRFTDSFLEDLNVELHALGLSRVLVLCTPEQRDLAKSVVERLGVRAVGLYPHAQMHVPVEVARRATTRAAETGAAGYVAIGGGSTIGLGKAIALESSLPIVAVPTTYAGSEMTPIWGLTENGAKRTGRDPRVLPRSVVYDPGLTLTLPARLSVTSGVNALAHAVEALYAPDRSPIVSLMAEEGVRAMLAALPGIVHDPGDLTARRQALYGSWLCGACLGATTMSLHHKLCHALGGMLNLPHADTHTVVLPYVLAYNQGSAHTAAAALSRVLGSDPATQLWTRTGEWGAPRSLEELGVARSDLDAVVEAAAAKPYANPRPVTRDGLRRLLDAAWVGEKPSVIE